MTRDSVFYSINCDMRPSVNADYKPGVMFIDGDIDDECCSFSSTTVVFVAACMRTVR